MCVNQNEIKNKWWNEMKSKCDDDDSIDDDDSDSIDDDDEMQFNHTTFIVLLPCLSLIQNPIQSKSINYQNILKSIPFQITTIQSMFPQNTLK